MATYVPSSLPRRRPTSHRRPQPPSPVWVPIAWALGAGSVLAFAQLLLVLVVIA